MYSNSIFMSTYFIVSKFQVLDGRTMENKGKLILRDIIVYQI